MWFRVDPGMGVPIYLQIFRQVEDGLMRGILEPGDRLPSVRQVAVEQAINPNTVAKAYRLLEERGLVETRRGTGTFVAAGSRIPGRHRELEEITDQLIEAAMKLGLSQRDLLDLIQRRILGSQQGGMDDDDRG